MAESKATPRGPVGGGGVLLSGIVGVAPNTSPMSALYEDGTQLLVIAWAVTDDGNLYGYVIGADGIASVARNIAGFVRYTTTAPVQDQSAPIVHEIPPEPPPMETP